VKFAKTANDDISSESISKTFRLALNGPASVAASTGDVAKALKAAAKSIEAVYEMPFLAHATMEPMSCVADVRADGCEVWIGTQAQEIAQATAAQVSGVPQAKVKIHTTFLGGGFGRRFETDFLIQA